MALFVWSAAALSAAPPLTVIQDTLYKADGSRFDGVLFIEWKSFEASDTSSIPQQSIQVRVTSGNFRTQLVPTTTALQSALYVARYNSSGRTQFTEYWSVPPSSTPLRIRDVRATLPGGVTTPPPGGSAVTITDIAGLRSELDVRPTKSPLFVSSRAAYISSTGSLESVAGNPSDCVRVDGTAAPCGTGSGSAPSAFIDGDAPAGLIDGANTTFTLYAMPAPAASVAVFRNGLLQQPSVDYSLNGQTLAFVAAAVPQPGDVVRAWYRTAEVPDVTFVDLEIPLGAIDGSNGVFNLSSVPAPATSLRVFRNGVLMNPTIDYSMNGATLTFVAGATPQPGDSLQASYRK
jgi:hypothetical protein